MTALRAGSALAAGGTASLLVLVVGTEPGGHPVAYLMALGAVLLGAIVAGAGLVVARRSLSVWVQVLGWLAVLLVGSSSSALLLAWFLVSGLPAAG